MDLNCAMAERWSWCRHLAWTDRQHFLLRKENYWSLAFWFFGGLFVCFFGGFGGGFGFWFFLALEHKGLQGVQVSGKNSSFITDTLVG